MVATAPASPERREIPLQFSGSAAEYFRIWIVNLGLTIVTVGLYSAWAKVRTRKYFYGNLRLDGSPFEYTADPKRILIGRLIVGAFAAVYVFATGTYPALVFVFLLLFFLASPWVVVRALSFNHRNTRWRNLRFAFRGSYGDATRVYVGWGLLTGLTLGLLAPVYHARRQAFMARNSLYGAERFRFEWRAADYYATYFGAGLLFGLGFTGVLVVAVQLGGPPGETQPQDPPPLAAFLAALPMFLAYGAAFVMIQAGTTNLLYRGASLAGHRFRSELRFVELFALYFTSALAIAASFGMLIPWAQIRLARYRASKLTLLVVGDLASFVAATAEAEKLGALADEAAVAFDFDFGL